MARHSAMRRFGCAALAVIFTMTAAEVCLPVPAEASSAHCPAPEGRAEGPAAPVMDCCVTSSHEAPALPDQTPASRIDPGKSAAGLDVVASDLARPIAPLASRERSAPPHGYHPRDLTTLYSVFLI